MMTNDWDIPGRGVEIYQKIFVPAAVEEWVPRVLELAKPKSGEKVLDLACGTGVLTRAAAMAIGQKGSVIGLDLSPDMLSLARSQSNGQFPTIEWREGNVQDLPFENQVFDIVFCELGFMFFPDRAAALREIWRVLKPGGRLGIMVWGALEHCPGQVAILQAWTKLVSAEQNANLDPMHSMGDPTILQSLLDTTGFKEIDVQAKTGSMRWPSAEFLARFYGAIGGVSAEEPLRTAIIRDVESAMEAYIRPEGLIYPMEAVLARAVK
jgi:SAM-dependent methyltransferase